ncbi:MAG TPA: GTP-binding protein [Acetobacteraceae bacterium]|nr:GTP-binding protein [Acetobacteraceae bacterium]
MRLKLFRAPAMAAAMAQVRAELGPDALILGTRRVAGGVEITAALEPDDPLPRSPLPCPAPSPLPPSLPDPARVAALQFHAVPATLQAGLQAGALDAALASALAFDSLKLAATAPPLLLSGPPGAGKTLTVARLATRLVMAGAVPMVITADGKRAGATEQLAAFTRLLGIDLIVASHPVTLGRALARRQDAAPVLIDAPGCDPFDPVQVEELAALAGTASARVVLVLPGGLDPAEAADFAAAFAAAGASQLVATRLDVARRLGGILAAAAAGGLALTEAGIGAGAADGLVPLTPAFLAERLLQTRMANP